MAARGLPFSTSTIHCRLTPDLLRQRLLVEAEPGSVVADKGAEIRRGPNAHIFLLSSDVSVRRQL
jgi:hypothetical protein